MGSYHFGINEVPETSGRDDDHDQLINVHNEHLNQPESEQPNLPMEEENAEKEPVANRVRKNVPERGVNQCVKENVLVLVNKIIK